MYGFDGKLVSINLSSTVRSSRDLDENLARKFLGGSGLGAQMLSSMNWKLDPLDPESILVFAAGTLTGTPVPLCSRFSVCAKSPLTGFWGEAHASGFWGPELKAAGFDAILIEGKAERPVYLFIANEKVTIKDARFLWGLDAFETEEAIKNELNDANVRVACIGQAGEKGSRLAAIINDQGRAAARCGLGAVMGSKNLKAIAVRGTKEVPVAQREKLRNLSKELTKLARESTAGKYLKDFGTAGGMDPFHEFGDVPIKNWKQGSWEEGCHKVSGQIMKETILKSRYACKRCPIGCGRIVKVDKGMYSGLSGKGPEYETAAAFGPLCLNHSLEAVAKANDLCNRYGLDTISTGAVVAFAMECFEEGLITSKETEGLELVWGNSDVLVTMVEKIGKREGLGAILADGCKRAAEVIGGDAHKCALHIKGLELPMHDPRAFSSWAVSYGTSNRGACHIQAPTFWVERGLTFPDIGLDDPSDRFSSEGKGRLTKIFQDFCEVVESSGICKFALYGDFRSKHVLSLLSYATGWDLTLEEMIQAGERSFNLKRLINCKCGISKKDDRLPDRISNYALSEGGTKGFLPDQESMLLEYYRERGWDENGIPTDAKVEELSLSNMVGGE
jgi:aldehyde:ferredoxin oxidoreductase